MAASVELLKAARAKIADPANWTRKTQARDAHGHEVASDSPRAVCWCASGALFSLIEDQMGDDFLQAKRDLTRVARRLYGPGAYIPDINDSIGHAAVMRIYAEAIKEAEASNA